MSTTIGTYLSATIILPWYKTGLNFTERQSSIPFNTSCLFNWNIFLLATNSTLVGDWLLLQAVTIKVDIIYNLSYPDLFFHHIPICKSLHEIRGSYKELVIGCSCNKWPLGCTALKIFFLTFNPILVENWTTPDYEPCLQ